MKEKNAQRYGEKQKKNPRAFQRNEFIKNHIHPPVNGVGGDGGGDDDSDCRVGAIAAQARALVAAKCGTPCARQRAAARVNFTK